MSTLEKAIEIARHIKASLTKPAGIISVILSA